jgi:hypothetical protein
MFSEGLGARSGCFPYPANPQGAHSSQGRSFSERRHKICAAEIVSETNAVIFPAPLLTTVIDWHAGCSRESVPYFILVRQTTTFRELT